MNLRRWLFITIAAMGIAPAQAEQFTVSARIFCPAALVSSAIGDVPDSSFNRFQLVPCAGLRVTARDSDTLFDEYCGSAYTNSRGEVRFSADCSDLTNRPDVYLDVEARSSLGFSVGVHHVSFFEALWIGIETIVGFPLTAPLAVIDYLTSHKTMSWVSAERLGNNNVELAFGDSAVGGDFAAAPTVSQFAAKQFWITQYSMLRFSQGTSIRPMDFNYSVDAPMGVPTTLYDTVVVDEDEFFSKTAHILQATPHEIGHVYYNGLHSGFVHWLIDGPDYMTHHGQCESGHFQTLAWYEGFANFMKDYAFQHWDWSVGDWTATYRPFRGCAITAGGGPVPSQVGLHLEGNVQAVMNAVFYGPVRAAQRAAIGTVSENDFVCPGGTRRVVSPGQPVKCESTYTPSCPMRWEVRRDAQGLTDICAQDLPEDPRCTPREPCGRPRRQPLACRAGDVAQRVRGADRCTHLANATLPASGGTPRARPDGSPDLTLGHNLASARTWFSLPSLDIALGWIRSEGTRSHRANEFWPNQIRPWCGRSLPGGTPEPYCDLSASASFRDEMSLISGDIR